MINSKKQKIKYINFTYKSIILPGYLKSGQLGEMECMYYVL